VDGINVVQGFLHHIRKNPGILTAYYRPISIFTGIRRMSTASGDEIYSFGSVDQEKTLPTGIYKDIGKVWHLMIELLGSFIGGLVAFGTTNNYCDLGIPIGNLKTMHKVHKET